MTVQELLDALSAMNPELPVRVERGTGDDNDELVDENDVVRVSENMGSVTLVYAWAV